MWTGDPRWPGPRRVKRKEKGGEVFIVSSPGWLVFSLFSLNLFLDFIIFSFAFLLIVQLRRSNRTSEILQPWVYGGCLSRHRIASRGPLSPPPRSSQLWVARSHVKQRYHHHHHLHSSPTCIHASTSYCLCCLLLMLLSCHVVLVLLALWGNAVRQTVTAEYHPTRGPR